jgi:myo-inositol-1(or 4)-monophosphatase
MNLEHVLDVARTAAEEAAKHVCAHFRQPIAVEYKHTNDLVTSLDRASEEIIRRRLAELPYAIIGEEGGGESKDGIGLYVDPIDGTTNFVHGHPVWCISIGLVDCGEPVCGLVLAPVLGIEWSGWVRKDSRMAVRRSLNTSGYVPPNSVPCVTSKVATIAEAFLATGFPYDRKTSDDDNFAAFFSIKKDCLGLRRCGSAAIELCLVADGTYDAYWERKLNPYDVAAGSAILRAAGGRVTDFVGGDRYLEPRGRVLASNGTALHDALIDRLAHTG